jgi:molecular chaperone GrpE (heat shock protein)
MKRLIILALVAFVAPAAIAQLYKYVDKDGKTVYSDTPPANTDSKQINVPVSRPPAPPAGTAAPKSAVELDKDLEKGRKSAADKQKKADEEAARVAQNELRCTQLKGNYEMYSQGGKIQTTNDKGERELMSDADIESARERTRREMDEACKK